MHAELEDPCLFRRLPVEEVELAVPAALAAIASVHSGTTRSKAFAIWATAQLAGIVVGGWYGGFVAERLDWRWVFWLVLVAFGGMILDLPATILQLTGILPALFPLWYSLCRMGASLIAVGIAVWMLQIYRRHGVWAMGRKAPSAAHARDEAAPHSKGG